MADSVLNIGLRQVRKMVPAEMSELDDDLFIMDVKYSSNLSFLQYPCRVDAYMAIFCKSSEGLEVECDLKRYKLKEKTLFISTPGNIMKIAGRPSGDLSSLEFIVLATSKEFMESLSFDVKKVFEERLNIMNNPYMELSDEMISVCDKYIGLFKILLGKEFTTKRESVGALVTSLFHSIAGMAEIERLSAESSKGNTAEDSSSTRTKLLFKRFMDLVTEYHTSERNMAFYADRLGLTPKYLSHLIKQASGRSAPDWIDSFVVLEAKNMLKYSEISIKEIVYKLNFPNSSVFYKFFKTHTGMTPSEYRKA